MTVRCCRSRRADRRYRTYVMIVGAGNKVERRTVRIATVTDNGVVVAEGLSGNERVVESAGQFLNAGERIRPERRVKR